MSGCLRAEVIVATDAETEDEQAQAAEKAASSAQVNSLYGVSLLYYFSPFPRLTVLAMENSKRPPRCTAIANGKMHSSHAHFADTCCGDWKGETDRLNSSSTSFPHL